MARRIALGALAPMPAPRLLVVAWSPALDVATKEDTVLRHRCNALFEALFDGRPCPAGWSVTKDAGGEAEEWVSQELVARRVDHPYLTDGSGSCAWCRRGEHRNGVCAMVAATLSSEQPQ